MKKKLVDTELSRTPAVRYAVIYGRISPRPDLDKSDSIESQMEMCTRWSESQGMTVKGKHFDKGISGASTDRPGLWAAMAELQQGDTLVVYKLDRLARCLYLSHSLERMAEKAGAAIVSISGEGTWEDTPENRMLRSVLRAADEMFREVNNRRTSDAMQSYIRAGRIMCNPKRLPYGWQLDSAEEGTMKKDPVEQEVVTLIGELCAKTMTAKLIARHLNQAKYRTRSGKVWCIRRVFSVIRRAGFAYPADPYDPFLGRKKVITRHGVQIHI